MSVRWPGLRAVNVAVVALWGALLAALVAQAPDADPAAADEAPRARLQAVAVETPVPEPEPAHAPEPEPEPAPAPAPKPAEPPATEPPRDAKVADVGPADLARGAHLLDGGGRFPVISASYEGLQSFGRYAAAMTAIGGRFVVVSHRRIVGEVDLRSGAIGEAALDRPFSPRARDYTDEPALADPARRVRERFGPDAEIMLLVPRAVDAGLFGAIARELEGKGDGHAAYREIQGRYERAPGGGLRFRLTSGLRMDGRRVELGTVFDLGAMADAGSAG